MDLEELKKSWKKTDTEIDKIIKVNKDLTDICRNNNIGLRNKVLSKYKVLCILCIVMTFISPLLQPFRNLHPAIVVTLTIYFIVLGILNYDLYKCLKKIDYKSMSLKDMLIATTESIIKRSRYQVIAYCMMIPLIVTLLWYFYTINFGMFCGGIFGAIVGLIIGLSTDIKIKRQIRDLKKNLEQELEEEEEED